jgi:hypothetical protein
MGAGTVSRDARPMPCDGEHLVLAWVPILGRWAAWSGTMRSLEPRWLGDPALVLGPWRSDVIYAALYLR